LQALDGYLIGQSHWLVNYAERHRAGLRVGTAITEGTANFLNLEAVPPASGFVEATGHVPQQSPDTRLQPTGPMSSKSSCQAGTIYTHLVRASLV
jgi:hypothetical protein